MDVYIVISRCGDEPHIAVLSTSELTDLLADDWKGYKFLDDADVDLAEFPSYSVLIIKGKVIVPKPKTVVTEYTLED